MTPEGKVKAKISKILKARDVYYFMPRGTALGKSGVPDYICCFRGVFIGIEAKAGRNVPTALQKMQLDSIKQHGGYVLVINENNVGVINEVLDSIISTSHYVAHCSEFCSEGLCIESEKI